MVWMMAGIAASSLWAATPAGQEPSASAASNPQAVASRAPAKSAIVTRIASDITVDGMLEEEVWQTAPTIGPLTQREPRTGEPPTEQTDVTLLHDDDYLYIGVMCYDAEPSRVIGTQMARDASLGSDDRILVVLDTYRDQRSAFYFATNPAGALVDGLVFTNGQSNLDWDAVWTVRTQRTSQGWSAEFAIPFKSLSFPAERTVWGFNIARHIQRKLEDDRWSGALLQTQFFQLSEAGEITNLAGLSQGIGLNVRPFAAGRWLHNGPTGRNTVTGKPGLDMFYNFTPSLKLTATLNTDFGETEVDTRQINLSRFSLFFPEKRTFFLEDAGVFNFGSTALVEREFLSPSRSEVIPFFSRQIGLLSGEEVPLDVGAKLTGKVGRTDLGVLDARTGDASGVSAKNFFVARVKRNFLQQSSVGAIFTDGHPALPIASRTYGADIRLATSRLLGKSRTLAFNAFGLRSVNEGTTARDGSYGISAEYPNDKIDLEFALRDVGEHFNPALGFVSRKNIRVLRIGTRYNPRPKDFLRLRQMMYSVIYNRFTRLDTGELESWNLHLATVDWHFASGDAINAFLSPQQISYERLFAPFEISPGVILPPGEYRFTRWRTNVTTASRRRLMGDIAWRFGRYWSGHAEDLVAVVTYRIPPRVNITFSTNQTFARLPQGDFTARILSTQLNYSASPFLSFSNLVQYDNRSQNLGWQSRVRWILQPGNDLFIVFTQGWIQDALDGSRFLAQDSKISAKVQYTSRF